MAEVDSGTTLFRNASGHGGIYCAACHDSSKGEGSEEFLKEHGAGGRASACNVCHTVVSSSNTALWPHQFQWLNRDSSGEGDDE